MGKVAENSWGQYLTQKDFRKQGGSENDTSNLRNRTDWSNSKQHLHLHNKDSLWKTLDSELILQFGFLYIQLFEQTGNILEESLNTEHGHFQVEGSMANEWDKDGYNGEESRTKRNGIR